MDSHVHTEIWKLIYENSNKPPPKVDRDLGQYYIPQKPYQFPPSTDIYTIQGAFVRKICGQWQSLFVNLRLLGLFGQMWNLRQDIKR